jgi:hypothetical protein
VNERAKPAVIASPCDTVPSRSAVRAVASVASSARPRPPPTWRDVLTSPEARPASRPSTPAVAAIVTGTKEQPIPAAATIEAPSTSALHEPSASIRDSQSIPIPRHVIPKARTRPGPKRPAIRLAIWENTMIAPVIGRNASPASSADSPTTPCR